MKVKIFDEAHEKDLEQAINTFLEENKEIDFIDIKFDVSCSMFGEEQIYCFSALLMYREKKRKV